MTITQAADDVTIASEHVGAAPALHPRDRDIPNYLLNIEYLEAAYLLGAKNDREQIGARLGVDPEALTVGRQIAFRNPMMADLVAEMAEQEPRHIACLRNRLGPAAVACPRLDLCGAFERFGLLAFRSAFDPYINETNFLLGFYILEDVVVTAYRGALPLLEDRSIVIALAGLLAAEASHAAIVRASLFAARAQQVSNLTMAIAQTRSALANGGAPDADDHGIGIVHASCVSNVGADGAVYARTPDQVLNILYGDAGRRGVGGGFFPDGMSGVLH